jgi:hypothetical protein
MIARESDDEAQDQQQAEQHRRQLTSDPTQHRNRTAPEKIGREIRDSLAHAETGSPMRLGLDRDSGGPVPVML